MINSLNKYDFIITKLGTLGEDDQSTLDQLIEKIC